MAGAEEAGAEEGSCLPGAEEVGSLPSAEEDLAGPFEPVCLLRLRTASLLPHSAFSASVPVQSLSFSANAIGTFGMMTGRIASKAGLWS